MRRKASIGAHGSTTRACSVTSSSQGTRSSARGRTSTTRPTTTTSSARARSSAYESPLGYDDAKVGGTFLKIGVGELEKPKEEKYSFANKYKVVKPLEWKRRHSRQGRGRPDTTESRLVHRTENERLWVLVPENGRDRTGQTAEIANVCTS